MSEQTILSDRYALEQEIARGGMATVWRATDRVLARAVAVKVLHEHLAADRAFVERFRFEALAAARLTHPHIVSIYDTGSEGAERNFIVMEYCRGGTLADRLAAAGPMDPDQVVAIGSAICDALAYAHGHGIVHRDVKPANVLFSEDDGLKVADFGIAKAAERAGDITTTGTVLGTVAYVSPEQARGEEPDPRSDVYSLGVVLYELVVGRPPFVGETQLATAMMHVNESPTPPRAVRAGVPRPLEAAILKALAKDRDERFESAQEMRAALTGAGRSATALLRPAGAPARRDATPPARAPREASPFRSLAPVIALVALAIAAVVILPGLLSDTGDGAPERPAEGNAGSVLDVAAVDDFDPEGDGEEHGTEAALAADGDAGTTWSTETYQSPLETQKSGVGLVFDLGSPQDVEAVEVVSPTPGYSFELRVADEEGSSPDDYEEVGSLDDAPGEATVELDEATSGQFWLVWITRLPDATGRASIAEVRLLGA